jgi:altronate dehydratase
MNLWRRHQLIVSQNDVNRQQLNRIVAKLEAMEQRIKRRQQELTENSDGGFVIEHRQGQGTVTRPQAELALKEWREWAQFVYLGGGVVTGSDEELRQRVCETHDDEVDELERQLQEERARGISWGDVALGVAITIFVSWLICLFT